MANYKGHIAGGIVAGSAVVGVYYIFPEGSVNLNDILETDWQLIAMLLTVSTLFGLWPDVDTNSKAQNLFYSIAFLADLVLIITEYYAAAAFLGLLAMTPIVGKHRGWTHSKIAMFLVPLPIIIIPYLSSGELGKLGILFYAASVAGYFSHLLLDGLIWKKFKVKGGW